MNDGDLERRALAAAAAARAEAEAREREEKRRREEEERRCQAEWDLAARCGAVRRLEEVLGHRTTPSEWGIWKMVSYRKGSPSGKWATFATLRFLGVDIRGNEGGLEVCIPADAQFLEGTWVELTLVSFGHALERRPSAEDG